MNSMISRALAVVALVSAAGCGDNDTVAVVTCGMGTTLDPATSACVPDGTVTCGNGTMLDPKSGQCVIDPNSCQDGTVLVGDQCLDPTQGLPIDLDEGTTEPNGYNVIEASNAPAGRIALKPVGQTYVIHGKIAPFRDEDTDGQLDADVDTYLLPVSGPTLLEVSADGLDGVDGGFVAIGTADTGPADAYVRFGMNITGDTSKRQLFLPSAGTYLLSVADTRTLFQYATGGPYFAAPGPGDYYVSIRQLDLPTPNALAPTNGTAVANGNVNGEIAFYQAPMGSGIGLVELQMPTIQTASAVDVTTPSAYRNVAAAIDPQTGRILPGGTTDLFIAGFATGDPALIAVDTIYNYAPAPAAYTLTVQTNDAQPLAGTPSETVATTAFNSTVDPRALNQYYFDVAAANETLGLNVAWNHPIVGSIYDGNLSLVARFTSLTTTTTWSSYAGLLRLRAPGRYYVLAFDPTGTVGTTQLAATAQVAQVAPMAIAEGTSTGPVALDTTFGGNAFTYASGSDPWQTFDVTGAGTGGQNVAWFDPGVVYGRLDALATSAGSSPANDAGVPIAPVFSHAYAAAGGAIGRVLLSDPSGYFIKVTPAGVVTGSPTISLLVAPRTITDFGPLDATGMANLAPGQPLDATTTTAGYYLFRTAVGNQVTLTSHPQDAALLNTRFRRVNADESAAAATVDNPTGDDTETFAQPAPGWTAVIVTATTPPATAQTYDFSVLVNPP